MAPSAVMAADYIDRSAWSWSTSSECVQENDIAGLKGIYDGDTSTCWHSNYHAESGTPERSNPHWVMIDRGSDTSLAYGLSYLPRQNGANFNTACTEYAIYFADRSLGSTTAVSWEDIVYELGEPDLQGSWTGDGTEKIVTFEKPNSARYILFVNIKSNGSNSAACAEMNLIAKEGGGTVTPTPASEYNAIKIVTPEGDLHRIAIDGQQLAFSMSGSNIRMGNSAITVEYAMDEVKYFQPEKYQFADEEFYTGPKRDIYDIPVEITLDQTSLTIEEGQTAKLTAELKNEPEGAVIAWSSSNTKVLTVDADGNLTAVAPGEATVTASFEDVSAECKVTVTEKPAVPVEISLNSTAVSIEEGKTFSLIATVKNGSNAHLLWISSDNAVAMVDNQGLVTAIKAGTAEISVKCGDATAKCVVTVTAKPVEDGIEAAEAPTLTLKREGESLIVGGIVRGTEAVLYSINGAKLRSAEVNVAGQAIIPVAGLARATYLLSVSGLTLKITI